MPFKSKAQRRKFYALKSRGEISQKEIDQWEKETNNKNLPERVNMITKEAAYKLGQEIATIQIKEAGAMDNALLGGQLGHHINQQIPLLHRLLGSGLFGGALGAGAGALTADDSLQGALMGGLTGAGVGTTKGLISSGLGKQIIQGSKPALAIDLASNLSPLATLAGGYAGEYAGSKK